jgi:hypothetical protein
MRKIIIYQKDSDNVEILDDSDTELEEYCQELSKIFQMTNVSILKTSHSTFIGRPSQLNGIVVEEMSGDPDEPEVSEMSDDPKPEGPPNEEIHEDIITDID